MIVLASFPRPRRVARITMMACATLLGLPLSPLRAQTPAVEGGSDPVTQCLEAGAGVIHHEVSGVSSPAKSIDLFAVPERTYLDIEACPLARESPRSGVVYLPAAWQRSGGIARLRIPCEQAAPIWLLETVTDRVSGEFRAFGQPSDWVVSCSSIGVIIDPNGWISEPLSENSKRAYLYPRLSLTLRPSPNRTGQPEVRVQLPLSSFVTPIPQSYQQVDESTLKYGETPGPCGYTDKAKPDQVSPFLISFSAYSPRSAIACGVRIAEAQNAEITATLEELKEAVTCLKDPQACPQKH